MSPHPDHPGAISTAIDIGLVAVILGSLGILLYSAFTVLARAVRAVTGWWRKRKAWLRGPGSEP